MNYKNKKLKLAVVGLGYVGLPLALEFGKVRDIVGFDVDQERIRELKSGIDKNLEVSKNEIQSIKKLKYSYDEKALKDVNCYIITVPTPIHDNKEPNLGPLIEATEIVAKQIDKGDLVIYESTVFPGCTEEICVPVIENISGLRFNHEFFCGYSPERINPGDKDHNVSNIRKVTSGSTPEIRDFVDSLYNEIVKAGTHKASSIKVAEAAKVIENTQRDLNIALINELSILFNKMNIDTKDVLDAAKSKWNFLPFNPGLVGGHCIGVDPYYLTYKAKNVGYHPKIILAGREINDNMGKYVASRMASEIQKKSIQIQGAKILIMGLTFKENCADIRNSGVESVINELKKFQCNIELYDPWTNPDEIKKKYNISPNATLTQNSYDGILITVAHDKFKEMGIEFILKLCKKKHIIYDLKYLFSSDLVDIRS